MEVQVAGLSESMRKFSQALEFWSKDTQDRLRKAHKQSGLQWVAEARKRCPVDEGRLRSSIRSNTYTDSAGIITTEVGSNVEYSKHLEFGTDNIAGGRVKDLGLSPEITDQMAIHDWPAKAAEATDRTSVSIDTQGGAAGRRRTATGQFTGVQEQMPFLRTGFMAIRSKIIDRFNAAISPPPQVN
jgi:hypothetical protein